MRSAPAFRPCSGERRELVAALQAPPDRSEDRLLVSGPAHAPLGLATMHGLQDVPAADIVVGGHPRARLQGEGNFEPGKCEQ